MNAIAKDLLTAVTAATVGLCSSGCAHQDTLRQYASQVPEVLECGELNGQKGAELADAAIGAESAEAFFAEVESRAKDNPADLACQLIDAGNLLVKLGRRYSKPRTLVQDALAALRDE